MKHNTFKFSICALIVLIFEGVTTGCHENRDEIDEPIKWTEYEPHIDLPGLFFHSWTASAWYELEHYNVGTDEETRVINLYCFGQNSKNGETMYRLYYNFNPTDFVIEENNLFDLKIHMKYLPENIDCDVYDFNGWLNPVAQIYETTFSGFEIFEDGHVQAFTFQELVPDGKMFDARMYYKHSDFDLPYFSYSETDFEDPELQFSSYKNSDGNIRIKYIGMMDGKFGRIPIIDHRRPIPDRVVVLKISGIYQHPDYDELVKGAEKAWLNTDG